MQHYLLISSMTVIAKLSIIQIVITLPMKTLSIFRKRQRQSMRRGQILSKFKSRRNCLEIIEANEAIHKIKESLQLFKSILIDECLRFRMNECLATIHNIVEIYYVIDIFLMDVQFDLQLDQVKNGNLPVECSWIELFLIIMNQDWPNEIYEECSAILSLSAYQLRMKIFNQKDQTNHQLDQLVNSLLYNIPFSNFINGSHYNIIGHLIELLQQLLTICKSAQTIQYLIQMNPNILQLVCRLFKNQKIMTIQSIKQSLIVTSLLVAYQFYQFKMYDQSNYLFFSLIQTLKSICFNDFLSPSNEEDFNMICRYVEVMSKSGIKLNKEEFIIVESTIFYREGAMHNLQSLNLINVIMSVNKYALNSNSVQILIQNMLQLPATNNDETVKLKTIQVILLKRHIDNCKHDQQTQNLYNVFQTNRDGRKNYKRLVQLIQFAHNHCELTFQLLIEFVYFLLTNDISSAHKLIKQQLFTLNAYQQFRLMLDELAYTDVSEELQLQ